MIITKQKPLGEILKALAGYEKIFLIGCGECSTTCKSGGEKELSDLKAELEKNGKTITGTVIPKAPCIAPQIKSELAKNRKPLQEAQVIVSLACGLGSQSIKDNNRLEHMVIPGCDTVCMGLMDAQGNFQEKCSACGECVLAITGGICPLTLCPKGLLNGPCGGMFKGKCEVNKDNDCAWVLIYKEMEKRKNLAALKNIQPAKNFQKMSRPRKVEAMK